MIQLEYLILGLSVIFRTFIFLFVFFSYALSEYEKIALLDIDTVVDNSIAIKKVKNILDKKRKESQLQIIEAEKLIEKKIKQYKSMEKSKKPSLKEIEKIEENYLKIKNFHKKFKNQMKQYFSECSNVILNKIFDIVSNIQKEQEYSFVFRKEFCVISKENCDITQEVTTILNDNCPEIKVVFQPIENLEVFSYDR